MPMQIDKASQPSTSQTAEQSSEDPWLQRAADAYRTSTRYMDTNFRKQWEDSIRAFNSQHPTDSKYTSPAYEKRSHLFRPKTRSVIRKNEAAAAAAFFSNMDLVSVGAEDQSNKAQLASADVMKYILEYRLRKSIPWFQVVLGGIQDSQVTGAACAHVYWDFRMKKQPKVEVTVAASSDGDEEYPKQPQLPRGAFTMGGQGAMSEPPEMAVAVEVSKPIIVPKVDKPVVDLVPIENIRIDPGASWIDPVNSSPYFIQMIPMYIMDIKQKIESGEWKDVDEAILRQAAGSISDSTRNARVKDREDPQESGNRAYSDIDVVWVQRHIHRIDDQDYDFYVLDQLALLTEPRPLEETVFHGMRPYVIGNFILEAHKIMPSGVPALNRGLQDEANEIVNQRLDNVKFVLNKKWFAKRGRNIDISNLVRNVPGSVIMMDDPTNDVREVSWPDVTGSAFEEQNRINLDFDELIGNFNPAALIMAGGSNAPARNMAMLSQSTGTLVEYGIKTFVETFVQPIMRQLIKLEQKYETDTVIMAMAGKHAQLFQKYGIDEVTDDLLNQELTLTVSVGMGATDPTQKLQKFLTAINSFANVLKMQVPGMNLVAVGKEIFAHLGYRDASRFFDDDNMNVAALRTELQKAQQMIAQMDAKLKDKSAQMIVGLQKTRETNATKIKATEIQEEAANKRALATHITAIMSEARQGSKNDKVSKPNR